MKGGFYVTLATARLQERYHWVISIEAKDRQVTHGA